MSGVREERSISLFLDSVQLQRLEVTEKASWKSVVSIPTTNGQ